MVLCFLRSARSSYVPALHLLLILQEPSDNEATDEKLFVAKKPAPAYSETNIG